MKAKTQIIYREVKKGHFVTPKYAQNHPNTTEREVRKIVPTPPKNKS